MVITALTRNQVARKGSWVRIPPPPPKSLGNSVFPGDFLSLLRRVVLLNLLKWCPWCPDLWCPSEIVLYNLCRKNVYCGAQMVPGTTKRSIKRNMIINPEFGWAVPNSGPVP